MLYVQVHLRTDLAIVGYSDCVSNYYTDRTISLEKNSPNLILWGQFVDKILVHKIDVVTTAISTR